MASFNRVILVGNLTRDPELRYIPSGTAVCEVGLAVNDRRKNASGEWIDETTFVDVTLWARTAEVASEYLTKGAPVLIEGRLKLDTWEKDGKKNSKLRVVGERMQMLGGKSGSGGGGGGRGGASRGGGGPSYDESEAGFGGGGESFDDSHGSPPPASKRESVGHGSPAPNDDLPF
jgi:single-strand DNA-binding protein